MKSKRFAYGCIIVLLTVGVTVLLLANYSNKLSELMKNTPIECNEGADECYEDLKRNVIFSNESRNIMIYTGVFVLITLNAGAFSLFHFCINKKDEENNEEEIVVKKKNEKRRSKK